MTGFLAFIIWILSNFSLDGSRSSNNNNKIINTRYRLLRIKPVYWVWWVVLIAFALLSCLQWPEENVCDCPMSWWENQAVYKRSCECLCFYYGGRMRGSLFVYIGGGGESWMRKFSWWSMGLLRERENVCVWLCVYMCERERMCVCVRERERVYVCVCVKYGTIFLGCTNMLRYLFSRILLYMSAWMRHSCTAISHSSI